MPEETQTAPTSDDAESSVWAGLLDEGDSGDVEWEESAPAEVEAEGTPEAKVEAVVEAPSAEPKVEVAQAPVQQAPQHPPQVPQPPPQQIDVARMREQWLENLSQRYQLTEEQAEKLMEDPRAVLPRLAAQVHAQAMQEAMAYQQRAIPELVRRQIQNDQSYARAQDEFFQKWPGLRGREAEVTRVAVAYRSMNPQASYADTIEGVGRMAHAMLNIPAEAPPQAQQTAAPPLRPPRPGAVSGRAATPTPTAPQNPFAALAETFLREDAETFEE